MTIVRKTQFVLVASLTLFGSWICLPCQAVPPASGDNELQAKVFCGYQGWFGAPGDGTEIGYDNYRYDGVFKPGVCVIDYWPELSEFGEHEKYDTDFRHADGSVAHVFSAANASTVDRHFQWMKDYGIDGVFLQRFGWALKQPLTLSHRERVLENVRNSAESKGRLWALMYDLTSLKAGDIEKYVIPDIRLLFKQRDISRDEYYARYSGLPVIGIWGVGFNDNRSYSLDECQTLVDFLKNDADCGGNAVFLGVPYHWRKQKNDAVAEPLFHEILRQADIISPWSVGRYRNVEQAQTLMSETLVADELWTRENKLGYVPVIFPGFSWHNLSAAEGHAKPLNEIPRAGGQFFWAQAAEVQKAGLNMVYVAMFDEMNEGTCIFKCTDNPPEGASPFLSYAIDQCPSDHYLWLTGQIGELLRGKIDVNTGMPTRR